MCLCLIATLLYDLANVQFVSLACLHTFPPTLPEMTILSSLSRHTVRRDVSGTEASDLQGGIASLWSVNEGALGTGVQGLKMEAGKRREERKKVLQGEPGTKDISAGDSNTHVVH